MPNILLQNKRDIGINDASRFHKSFADEQHLMPSTERLLGLRAAQEEPGNKAAIEQGWGLFRGA